MAPTTAPSPLEQVRDLETQFASAMTQLYAVGNGLARVRQDLADAPVVAPAATPAAAPVEGRQTLDSPVEGRQTAEIPAGSRTCATPQGAVALPAAAVTPSPATPSTLATPATPPTVPLPPTQRWWERPGAVAKVLGAVGAVVTLIGVAFLLAIAIAAGVFGPVPRTIAGALLAAALLVGGAAVRRRSPESPGGEALAATGLAAAYLDLLAATALYHFIPGSLGLVVAAVLAVGAFVLARSWNSELLAVLAAAPPILLAPAVTGGDSLATMSFVALLLVGSAIAHLGREWPWLYAARVVPAVAVLLWVTAARHDIGFPEITVTVAVALGMVAAGVVEQSRRLTLLPTGAATAAALPMLLAVSLLPTHRLSVAAALSALFIAVSTLVAHLPSTTVPSRSLWIAPLAAGTMLLVQASIELPEPAQTGIALAVASGAYGVVAIWRRSPVVATGAVALAGVSTLWFLPALVSTTSASASRWQAEPLTLVHGLLLTAVAVIAMVFSSAVTGGVRQPIVTRGAAVVAFVLGSATVVTTGTWLGTLVDNPRVGFYGGHAAATALWTVLAAVLMTAVARRSRDSALMVRVGLILVAAAVAKLFLFDLSALSGLFRVVAFVVTGVIVLVLGVLVSREQRQQHSTT